MWRWRFSLALLAALAAESLLADVSRVFVREVNMDPLRIGPYELEDPLRFADGRRVKTREDWCARRSEILELFAREMYGAEPPRPEMLQVKVVDEKVTCGGFAVRRQYQMRFRPDGSGPCVNWIVWIPQPMRGPVPLVIFLNYNGNHELVPDRDIPLMRAWNRMPHAGEEIRGRLQDPNGDSVFPIGVVLARGYAVMSACYCEISPDPDANDPDPSHDQEAFAHTGVFALWGPRDPSRTDGISSLGAWAWAYSRGVDLAERIPEVDAARIVVTGCSRLGKAALLAAARDERIAVCVPNQSGSGGCSLAKRDFGENVSTLCRTFPHWFAKSYGKYAEDPARLLRFDQHLLMATLAPRALLVEGFDNPWFDTEGEFLAVRAARGVWSFLGRETMPDVGWPADESLSAVGSNLGYVRRSGRHGYSAKDWLWTLDFADRHWTAQKEGIEK